MTSLLANEQFSVSVETCDAFCIAFAFEWPGACGWGPTLEVALDRLRRDVAFMSSWLAARGFDVVGAPAAEAAIVERLPATGDPTVECDTEGFYAWDAEPHTDAELAQTAMMLGFSRAELLTTITGLSDAALDVRLVEGKRTIREIIDHIAITEWWYTTRTLTEPSQAKSWRDYGRDAHERLAAVRDMFLRDYLPRLAEMPDAERAGQYVQGRETWSTRKTLRRAFWHEMLHYKQLLRLVPKVLARVGR